MLNLPRYQNLNKSVIFNLLIIIILGQCLIPPLSSCDYHHMVSKMTSFSQTNQDTYMVMFSDRTNQLNIFLIFMKSIFWPAHIILNITFLSRFRYAAMLHKGGGGLEIQPVSQYQYIKLLTSLYLWMCKKCKQNKTLLFYSFLIQDIKNPKIENKLQTVYSKCRGDKVTNS